LAELLVGGVTPLTSTDYPGCLSAVIFCQGCPWRCSYCQNPHLIPPRAEHGVPWREVISFLERRWGLLDAVVFSGGEPTLQAALPDAIREVRALGFRIGLHTASPYPELFQSILPLLDWVGLDIKAPFEQYEAITGVPSSGEKAREGLALLLESGVDYEVRTTVHAQLHTAADLIRLAQDLRAMAVENYVLQEFRPQGCANAPLCITSPPILNADLSGQIAPRFKNFAIRRA
jgi:pyruvate formate lyase activating enzyme